MHIRHAEIAEVTRELSPNLNPLLGVQRTIIEKCFKELIPETLAGAADQFDYRLMTAFVAEYPNKSYLLQEHSSLVISNYSVLESTVLRLARPEVLTVAGDVGSGKTTALRALKYFLEAQKRQIYVLYVHLRLASVEGIPGLIQWIKAAVLTAVQQDLTRFLECSDKIDKERPILEQVFEEDLVRIGAIDKSGKVRRRSVLNSFLADIIRKCSGLEFNRYCRAHFAFLHSKGFKSVLILDDVDLFDDQQLAGSLVDRAQTDVASALGIPVVISIRHETVMKFRDGARPVPARHVIRSVDSANVLTKRVQEFAKWAQSPDLTEGAPLSEEQIRYVQKRSDQFLAGSIIRQLERMNPSCEFVLDVFRTVLLSPIIRPQDDLTWKRVFNTLMLHIWTRMQPTSFVLNVFDNGADGVPDGQEYKNTLLRIRLMQAIAHEASNTYHRQVEVKAVRERLRKCGYDSDTDVTAAITECARRRVIITTECGNGFDVDRVTHIYMHPSLRFYLEYLVWDYLYLENIIPVSLVDVAINMDLYNDVPTLDFDSEQFKIMDANIYAFLRFVSKCEQQEEQACAAIHKQNHNVASTTALDEIRGPKRLTDELVTHLKKQIHGEGGTRELEKFLHDNWRAGPYPYYRPRV